MKKMNKIEDPGKYGRHSYDNGYMKQWWRVGCSLHIDEAIHCQDLGRLVPRTIIHNGLQSLPKFNFPVLYLEEDRTEESYDPYGNVRLYIEFHKFLSYFGSQLKLYLIDEFVENRKSITRLLITKRSMATLPLSVKKIDFNGLENYIYQNQVTIKNTDGSTQVLDHHLHVVVESTDDTNKWLYHHCIRRPVNHKPNSPNNLANPEEDGDSTSIHSQTSRNSKKFRNGRSRRSSISHDDTPYYKDTAFDGCSCYLTFSERRSCPSAFSVQQTKSYLTKVRSDFFRQMDVDFVV